MGAPHNRGRLRSPNLGTAGRRWGEGRGATAGTELSSTELNTPQFRLLTTRGPQGQVGKRDLITEVKKKKGQPCPLRQTLYRNHGGSPQGC